ncbi:ectoine/hydroxyectoine ABC transporter substrate-binding protein EhuB [Litchfieldella rifensis]|uniref:Ectoine/hydroxyectoine ABC transporter substrate-binding protein EhuB n=1 Tax=Litchfieldella rifensis TaxID=762643 RepID=A0ABV7LVA9_9GAMM
MNIFRTAITANVLAVAIVASTPALAVTLDELRERGAVRAAFANESPYGYVNEEGVLTGESPEVARVIFNRLGVENLDGILTEWASLLPGLNAGRWDMVAAGMFITPGRCKEVAFSNPSYMMGQSFLVQAGNPHDLHSYEDVANNDEVTLGVLAGAVERGYARDAGIPDSQVQELPDQTSMLAAVRTGRIDAAALTSVSIERMAQLGGDRVERAEPFDTPPEAIGYGGFAFRKADEALIEEFNAHLADFIGSEEHLELVRPFGFTEANLPGDTTAEELCQGS